MSIDVTVKNNDSRESAVIGVRTQWTTEEGPDDGPKSVIVHDDKEVELKGGPDGSGESKQLLVHGSQQIIIRELRQ